MQNRNWILARRPIGNDYAAALALESENLPPTPDGRLLIKNRVLSMDSGTRMYMTDREDSYQPGVPLGSKMIGTVVGEVVESRQPDFSIGDNIRCYGNWADYSVVDPGPHYAKKLPKSDAALREFVGVYGANGWTAYIGVIEVGAARAGDVFLVSAAAGCTGIMAGQIAKIAGCTVVGTAGSEEKCALLTREYGFDAAINYKTQPITSAVKDACPNGVNVYFDNVGGDTLDAVLPAMANFGRVAVCGLIKSYVSDERVPGPTNFDLVLMKRLRIEGFFSPDFYRREDEINPILQQWAGSGALRLPFDVSSGLESTVAAYTKLFTGANVGKVVVELPA